MAGFVKGDLVVIPFPFSDLSGQKKRPALVLASLIGNDLILCQITTQNRSDPYSVTLQQCDLDSGTLTQNCFIRPNRLFTADQSIILYRLGKVSRQKQEEVLSRLRDILGT